MTQFKRFKLPNILLEDSTLILNTEQGILSLLTGESIVEQQILSPSEMALVSELLKAYPEYCPNEILLSVHANESLETSRQQLLSALKDQTMHELTKRLRAMLARCRKKLHPFGIDIVTLLGRGCTLKSLIS